MRVKEGHILQIHHVRKGKFRAFALYDFDTEEDEFYSVMLDENQVAHGVSRDPSVTGPGRSHQRWDEGDAVNCRSSLVKSIEIVGHIDEEVT